MRSWVWSGLNVVEEKRLAFAARGIAPLFETVQLLDFGRCKLCIAVPDGFDYRGAAIAARQAHRDDLSAHPGALPGGARHRRRGRGAVRLRGDRAAARAGGSDLRSGVDRLDAGGESPAPGGNGAREPSRADPHAGADRRGETGVDAAPADAHRRRGASQGQQVHHAARAALGAGGDREAAARQRGADGHSARRARGPGGGARGMPRKCVLGNARGTEGRRARPRCWCCRSRKCWPEGRGPIMRILDWKSLSAAQRDDGLAAPGAERRRARRAAAAQTSSTRCAAKATPRCSLSRNNSTAFASAALRVTPQEFAAAERALSAAQIAAIERAIANVRRFHAAQGSRAAARRDIAPGVVCERFSVPIRAVGLYVPAGSAPLPSTAIMLAVPAAIAGCPVRVHVHAARRAAARADPAVLVGRAQGRASNRYSRSAAPKPSPPWPTARPPSPSATRCSGPAMPIVTAAKMLVAQDPAGAARGPAGRRDRGHGDRGRHRARRIRRRRPARAGRAQSRGAGPAGHDLRGARRRGSAAGAAPGARLSRAAILAKSTLHMRAVDRRHASKPHSTSPMLTRPSICCSRYASRARWLDQVQRRGRGVPGTLVAGIRWATTAAGPTTPCPPTATPRPTAACRSRTFRSASRCRSSRRRVSRDWGRRRRILANLEGLDAHAAAVTIRLAALGSERRPRRSPRCVRQPRGDRLDPVVPWRARRSSRCKPYAHAAWLPALTRLHANEAPWRPAGDTTAARPQPLPGTAAAGADRALGDALRRPGRERARDPRRR